MLFALKVTRDGDSDDFLKGPLIEKFSLNGSLLRNADCKKVRSPDFFLSPYIA